jgi:RND family efflux transporter MFP subunit
MTGVITPHPVSDDPPGVRTHPPRAWLLGFAALLAAACSSASEPPPQVVAAPAEELVATARVRRGEVTAPVITTGSIAARRSSPIGPSVPGRILAVFVHVGDEVPLGTPLFQIDPGPYAIAVQAAEAGLALARAELDNAREDARSAAALAEKEIVSREQHRQIRTRLAIAGARVEQAESALARARDDLFRTFVLAPYAAIVVERLAHEGTMATVTPNTTVVVLHAAGELEAVLSVPEATGVSVRTGDAVRLSIEGVPEPMESEVSAVTASVDPATRTYKVRAPVRALATREPVKAGAFVHAEIAPRPREAALLVDRTAVAHHDGSAVAFRAASGRVERVTLRLGTIGERDVEVIEGLADGDEVVVGEAVARLSDGARIRTGLAPPVATARP